MTMGIVLQADMIRRALEQNGIDPTLVDLRIPENKACELFDQMNPFMGRARPDWQRPVVGDRGQLCGLNFVVVKTI